jgi:hypothetical protein
VTGQFISDLSDPSVRSKLDADLMISLCSLDEARAQSGVQIDFLDVIQKKQLPVASNLRMVDVLLVVILPILASSPFPSSHDITGCLHSSFAFGDFLPLLPHPDSKIIIKSPDSLKV